METRQRASDYFIVNKILLVTLFLGVAVGGYFFFGANTKEVSPSQTPSPQATATPVAVDDRAGFAIFTNGTFRIFTAAMYHNRSENVFIQTDDPNVIHIKKAGITWNDFFATLPIKLTKECLTTGTKQTFCTGRNGTLQFYRNGRYDKDALDRKINHGDHLLVSFGNESEDQIQKQLQQVPNVQ